MLLDTSGLLCLLHKDEPQHAEANRLYMQARECLTQSYVLADQLFPEAASGRAERDEVPGDGILRQFSEEQIQS